MPFEKKYDIDKDIIIELYWDKKYTIMEVAEHFGCNSSYILRFMKDNGIARRKKGRKKINLDKDTVKKLYWDTNYSIKEIAEHYDCSSQTITKFMVKHEIPRRNPKESLRIYYNNINQKTIDRIKLKEEILEKLDKNEITHKDACILYSCDYTVSILNNVVFEKYPELKELQIEKHIRTLEKKLYKDNKYLTIPAKIGVALYVADFEKGKREYTQRKVVETLNSVGLKTSEITIKNWTKYFFGVKNLHTLKKRAKQELK